MPKRNQVEIGATRLSPATLFDIAEYRCILAKAPSILIELTCKKGGLDTGK